MPNPVQIAGLLKGGNLAPGGETSGFVLLVPPTEVDTSGLPPAERNRLSALNGKRVSVEGTFTTRTFPLRGVVRVIEAQRITDRSARTAIPDPILGDVFLIGTLNTGIIRPGGETTGTELRECVVEVEPGGSGPLEPYSDQEALINGTFALRHFIERGDLWTLVAEKIQGIKPRTQPPFGDGGQLLARPSSLASDAAKQTATGYSYAFDFGEAFLDAVRHLPKPDNDVVDFLDSVFVLSTHGEFGGIAGIRRLAVTVGRLPFPSASGLLPNADAVLRETAAAPEASAFTEGATLSATPPSAIADDSHLFAPIPEHPVTYRAYGFPPGGKLIAEGTKRTSGAKVFFRAIPAAGGTALALPRRFELRERSGVRADVLTEFAATADTPSFGSVTVVDADGEHEVPIRRTFDPR